MAKISVVINTLNEEKNLPRCLSSLGDLADEVIVVDMKSTDATRTLARRAGASVYEHARMGYVEPARNFAISKTTGDWVLVLDADEELTAQLVHTLKKLRETPTADYYRLPRKNIVFGKWIKHSRWWPDYNIRFFKKGFVEWSELIHSVPTTKGKGIDLEGNEENAIVHHHYDTIDQYVARMNRYTTMQAKEMRKNKYYFKWRDLIRKPMSEFLSRYFQGEGYKDGIHGLGLSLLQAFSELVLYLKLWELSKFKSQIIDTEEIIKELKTSQKELNYWNANVLCIKHGGIVNQVKRKFKLP
ncbi:glycosyltransferase family 2 protein [Candidatus Woesebacteria bacterium]|nr:MAG: glycosyltransferase family 2 protein [Candidatus Woesebacteria bacterium]